MFYRIFVKSSPPVFKDSKHLCWSPFYNKVKRFISETLLMNVNIFKDTSNNCICICKILPTICCIIIWTLLFYFIVIYHFSRWNASILDYITIQGHSSCIVRCLRTYVHFLENWNGSSQRPSDIFSELR